MRNLFRRLEPHLKKTRGAESVNLRPARYVRAQDIRQVCRDLAQLRQQSAEELQHSVLDNYNAFIRRVRAGCATCAVLS